MEKDRSVVHILLSSLDKCFKDTFLVHRHQCQDNAPLHTHTHTHIRIRCADSGGTAPSVQYIMATVSTSSVLWDISIWRLSPDNHNRPLTRSCDKNCKPPPTFSCFKTQCSHPCWWTYSIHKQTRTVDKRTQSKTKDIPNLIFALPVLSREPQYEHSEVTAFFNAAPKQCQLLWECTSKEALKNKNTPKTYLISENRFCPDCAPMTFWLVFLPQFLFFSLCACKHNEYAVAEEDMRSTDRHQLLMHTFLCQVHQLIKAPEHS